MSPSLRALLILDLPALLLAVWGILALISTRGLEVDARLPLDQGRREAEAAIDLSGRFLTGPAQPGEERGSWLRFRGEHGTNLVHGAAPLLEDWPPEGPPRRWRVAVGDGHAGPAVRDGRVYLLDHDETGQRDVLRCLSLADGGEIWRRSYPIAIKRNHGISRTVPTLAGDSVVAMGPKCHVICCEAESGDFRWGLDPVRELGAKVPLWYTAQCPLVDGDTVVLAIGGPDALLLGLDLQSGKERWRTPNPDGWTMSHASILRCEIAGVAQYIYPAIGGVVSVAADGSGRILWTSTAWKHSVVAPSPVQLGDVRLLLPAGYGAGSLILAVTRDGTEWTVKAERELPVTAFACEQHTPIVDGDRVYTIMPKDATALRQQLVCIDTRGEPLWSSGPKLRYGLGPFLQIDDRMLVLDDRGELSLLAIDNHGCRELAKADLLDGRDSWGPMAFVDGLLLLRDDREMICIDLRKDER